MIIADLAQIAGRTYPARRRTQNLVGGMSPIQATNFSMGHVTLEPRGGQVPWHNQEQEEIYFIVEGTGERPCTSAEVVLVQHISRRAELLGEVADVHPRHRQGPALGALDAGRPQGGYERVRVLGDEDALEHLPA